MSILLEALKKSEEQRQLGETPTIHTHVDSQPVGRDSLHHWIPLSLMALSIIVIAWFGWQQFRQPDPASPASPPATLVEAGETAAGQNRVAEPTAGPDAADVVSPPASPDPRTPVESFQAATVVVQAEPDSPAQPQPQLASDEQVDRLSQSLNENASDESAAAEKPPSRQVVAETPGAAVSPPPEPQPRQTRAKPRQPEPISYWELPQGVRDTFSEIKITVLVYSENASERFVLINGQRLVEKDELQGGIVLDEIRRGGAVFLYRKYRFLVKG